MPSFNRITIVGHVGRAPELKYTQSNIAFCTFSVATSKRWKDKNTDEWKENTTWHRVKAWRYDAEKAAKLDKGSLVLVEGTLESEEWTDKEGNKRETMVITPTSVVAFSRQQDGGAGGGRPPAIGQDDDDGLPF
jgi:single-strand DNA-binding protein